MLAAPDGRVVATTDTLVHGPDFRLAWSSGFDLGWKAAAVNLADIAAMGARPTALLVALAMPNDTTVSFVEGTRATDFAPRATRSRRAARSRAATSPSRTRSRSPSPRSARSTVGRPCCAAARGRATSWPSRAGWARPARGLALLFDRFRDAAAEPVPVDLGALSPEEAAALDAQLRPSPPVALGVVAADAGATAMMDVSDGLVLDASRMAAASGVTLDIDTATLGADLAEALTGGEDHALLATFPATVPLPDGFRAIGRVIARSGHAVLVDGAGHDGRGGWDPYRDWDAHGG